MSNTVSWSDYCKKWAKVNNVSYAAAMQLCRKDYYAYKEANNDLEKVSKVSKVSKANKLDESNQRINKRKKKFVYAEEVTSSSSSSEEEDENYYGRKVKRQHAKIKVVHKRAPASKASKVSKTMVYEDDSEEDSD